MTQGEDENSGKAGMESATKGPPDSGSTTALAEDTRDSTGKANVIALYFLSQADGNPELALNLACQLLASTLAATSFGFARGEPSGLAALVQKMQHTD